MPLLGATNAKLNTKFQIQKGSQQDWHKIVIRLSEAAVWILTLVLLAIFRLTTTEVFADDSSLFLVGIIIAFALAYYTYIYKHFNHTQRHYIKDIADVILIGILSMLAKDYGPFFFVLYILPIAAAAFALNVINSLVIATFASLFITANILSNSSVFPSIDPAYLGSMQIIFLLVLSFFTRALALQLRAEKTERTHLQQRLDLADQKLEDIEALEEEFVMTATHQLNTPLSIVRGYSSLLLDPSSGKLTPKQKKYAKEINEGSRRLSRIIKDLLDIAALDRTEGLKNTTHVDLETVIRQAMGLMEQQASTKDIKLVYKGPKDKLKVEGHEGLLTQAILNLIDNGVKYTSPNTSIKLTLENDAKKHAIITVSDQGIGIPVGEQNRIFQRFYRASNSKKLETRGTGLGLYITKEAVIRHGGSIRFVSKENEGTCFEIKLPLS